MPFFNVPVTYKVRGTYYNVQANSQAEANEKVLNSEKPYDQLPEAVDMVDDTFEIDRDSLPRQYRGDASCEGAYLGAE